MDEASLWFLCMKLCINFDPGFLCLRRESSPYKTTKEAPSFRRGLEGHRARMVRRIFVHGITFYISHELSLIPHKDILTVLAEITTPDE